MSPISTICKASDNREGPVATIIGRMKSAALTAIKPVLAALWPVIQVVRRFRGQLWLIDGQERSTGENIKIAFSGSRTSRNYWTHLVFEGAVTETSTGTKWLREILRIGRLGSSSISMAIVEVPGFFFKALEKQDSFYIPCWIRGETVSFDEMPAVNKFKHHESVASDIRKIKKHGLSFEISRQPQHFDEFYNEMYLPFIALRHAGAADFDDYSALRKQFNSGEIIFINKDGKHIAGCIITYNHNRAWLWVLGISQANMEYVKMGAASAIYYYSFIYLREKGYERASVGGSRAFLRNGVLRYKKKWGLKIIGSSWLGYMVKVRSNAPVVNTWLTDNPFIFRDGNGLSAAYFISREQTLDEGAINEIFDDYYYSGLKRICVYRLDANGISQISSIPGALNKNNMTRSTNYSLTTKAGGYQ